MIEDTNQLMEVRNEVATAIQQLALRQDDNPEVSLQILMSVVNSGSASLEIYRKVLDLIKNISDDERQDEKMNLLLDLLYDIDDKLAEPIAEKDE